MEKNIENWLVEVCNQRFESGIKKIESLRESGSARQYYRIFLESSTAILCVSANTRENKTFIHLSHFLYKNGISVPEIYAVSNNYECYLLEDVGNEDFLQLLSGLERNENLKRFIGDIISQLVSFQQLPPNSWKEIVEFQPLDEELISYDCCYALDNFFRVCGKVFDEENLIAEFAALQEKLMAYPQPLWGLMFRDFQSRNIMIREMPYFIDYQSSRRGPGIYDLVSFAWQAKANFSVQERSMIVDLYIGELKKRGIDAEEAVRINLPYWAMFRILQTLGAYGLRGLKEGKRHFIDSIPAAITNIKYLKEKGLLADYPEIEAIAERLEAWQEKNKDKSVKKAGEENGLTIRVFSFSYKKGYPDDESGNGGGFIFDCRGMHNPGRYEEYKQKTGLDREVIEFLEERGEARRFVETCVELTIPTIKRYIARGFTSLLVGFGCTGGQHRSVFCAEGYAKKISELFPEVKIITEHREQNIVTQMGVTDKN